MEHERISSKYIKAHHSQKDISRNGLLNHRWTTDISGELSTEELVQLIRLWEIAITAQLNPTERDEAVWPWNSKQVYTSASAYQMLCKGTTSVTYAWWI